jgi:hypothetical protein
VSTIDPVAVALDAVELAGDDGAVWSLPHDGDDRLRVDGDAGTVTVLTAASSRAG